MIHTWNLFEDKLRYDYPLNENSIVIDVGGYKGDFSEKIYDKYKCNVIIYEPVKLFFNDLVEKFKDNEKISIINMGLSNEYAKKEIKIQDDASGLYAEGSTEEIILAPYSCKHNYLSVDLLKINIEGEEYKLMDDIISNECHHHIKNIQIQWHNFYHSAEQIRKKISEELSKTHYLTYQFNWLWENWTLKNQKYNKYIENFNMLAEAYNKLYEEHLSIYKTKSESNQKIADLEHEKNKMEAILSQKISDLEHEINLLKIKCVNT